MGGRAHDQVQVHGHELQGISDRVSKLRAQQGFFRSENKPGQVEVRGMSTCNCNSASQDALYHRPWQGCTPFESVPVLGPAFVCCACTRSFRRAGAIPAFLTMVLFSSNDDLKGNGARRLFPLAMILMGHGWEEERLVSFVNKHPTSTNQHRGSAGSANCWLAEGHGGEVIDCAGRRKGKDSRALRHDGCLDYLMGMDNAGVGAGR